jgi:hypothetical protein
MKFCKNLQKVADLSNPEWSPYWTDYKKLKVSETGGYSFLAALILPRLALLLFLICLYSRRNLSFLSCYRKETHQRIGSPRSG